MIARAHLIDVLFVIAPHSLLLDIAGPAEAFRLANLHRERRGLPPRFRLRFAGAERRTADLGRACRWPASSRCRSSSSTPTWVVVVGQPSAHLRPGHAGDRRHRAWLNATLREPLLDADTPHRLLTICSGTLLAARAGLLGTAAAPRTTSCCATLRALAPQAQVIDNRVFVVDGPLASSAGITAGIDLALHLIAEECGEALAASVAEDMVVYLRRSPRDPELSPFHMHRRHLHPTVHRVQDAIVTEPERDWDMAALARGRATRPSGTCCGCSSTTRAFRRCTTSGRSGSSARGSRWNAARASRARRSSPASAPTCSCAAPGAGSGAGRRAMRRAAPAPGQARR